MLLVQDDSFAAVVSATHLSTEGHDSFAADIESHDSFAAEYKQS